MPFQDGFSIEDLLAVAQEKWNSFTALQTRISCRETIFESATLLGVVATLPHGKENPLNEPLILVSVSLPEGQELGARSSRKKQFEFAKKIIGLFAENPPCPLKGSIAQGLFAFSDDHGNFRLSLVTSHYDKQGKIQYNAFRRQSFYVEAGHENATFRRYFLNRSRSQLTTLEDVREAFSVEALTKEFYTEIEKWFLWARQKVTFPKPVDAKTHDEEHNATQTLRLITRLIFIWFLKQKKLVPAELFEKSKIHELLNFTDKTKSTYYKAILQNLFFATLNTPLEKRAWVNRQAGKQEFFRYKRYFKNDQKFEYLVNICGKVPFVNGGLFENLDGKNEDGSPDEERRLDCFSNRRDNEMRLIVPDELFLSDKAIKIKVQRKSGIKEELTTGILTTLGRYDFTITENSPSDEDVSLDPELLGRVFENLLAYVNPETSEQARKSTGSFYTPREIVNYMVDEALKAYLGDIKQLAPHEIEAKLKAVCVLDPACGSGAFPMGILMRMIEILEEQGVLNADDAEAVYRTKLELIKNCIYGVDIQNIAVQISKLRFFISLLCEQKTNDDPQDNYGVCVLPNLETKFVAANSLIAIPRLKTQGDLFDDVAIYETKNSLKNLRLAHFGAQTPEEKHRIRRDDKCLRLKLAQMLSKGTYSKPEEATMMATWDPYDPNNSATFFDSEIMFGIKDGFDIVIGNPPYISAPMQVKICPKQREMLAKSGHYKTLCQKWDLYIPFLELGTRHLLKKDGVCTMIVPYPLTNQTYALEMRKMLVNEFNLFEIVDLNGTKVFESATVSNCIPFVQKKKPQKKTIVSKINERREIYHAMTHDNIVQDENTYVWNLTGEKSEIDKHRGKQVFGDYCYISVGMVLNADEKTAKGEFTKDDLISETKDKIHCREYVEAKDIDRYAILRTRYLEYNTKRCPDKLRRPTFRELYEHDKLLLNCLGDIKIAIDLKQKYLHNHSLYCAVPWHSLKGVQNKSITSSIKKFSTLSRNEMEALSRTVDLKYLLGVMNSKYASVLLTNIRGGDYHIYPEHIRNIPIPSATPEQQKPIIALVNKILAAKGGVADSGLLRHSVPRNDVGGADTSELERKIDELVYQLYGLTEDEIAIVEAASAPARDVDCHAPTALAKRRGKTTPVGHRPDLDGEDE